MADNRDARKPLGSRHEKSPYQTPHLARFGRLKAVTAGGSAGQPENNPGQLNRIRP